MQSESVITELGAKLLRMISEKQRKPQMMWQLSFIAARWEKRHDSQWNRKWKAKPKSVIFGKCCWNEFTPLRWSVDPLQDVHYSVTCPYSNLLTDLVILWEPFSPSMALPESRMKNLASNFKPLPGLNFIGVNKLYQNIVFWFHKQYLVSCTTC